ncbi:GTP cyclohydrolase [Maribacter sp. 2210JD10-5]|uniref:GTP cyclohydrolase n=1 Tax=Maribacter sp. 2210JD10-5 TaxID=3386272 RepID=UPI0039BC7B4B
MKTIEKFMNYRLLAILLTAFMISSCSSDDDAPEEENDEEVITNVTLIFTNTSDPNDVVRASAEDPDGEGVQELEVMDFITLSLDTEYTLTFEVSNALDPNDVEDITAEILKEDNEHQIFFSFTDGAFASPTGNGNVDNASDPLNYNDEDENGNPVGLSTSWTTPATSSAGGTFNVRLQHQPDLKTATTGADVGDSDFDLDFVLNIQ